MKMYSLLVTGLACSFWLMGCTTNPSDKATEYHAIAMSDASGTGTGSDSLNSLSHTHSHQEASSNFVKESKPSYNTSELIKITGIGYGAASAFANVTKGQRLLMAIRASKLDAYRSLAEQLHGIKIDSNTAISTLTAKNDSFRARVNALVRGARVVSITPMADNNYETVLEVYVDSNFFRNTFVYSNNAVKNPSSGDCHGFSCR